MWQTTTREGNQRVVLRQRTRSFPRILVDYYSRYCWQPPILISFLTPTPRPFAATQQLCHNHTITLHMTNDQ